MSILRNHRWERLKAFSTMILSCFLCSSCSPFSSLSDFERSLFRKTRQIMFSSAQKTALTQVHLENTALIDRSVLVRGEVIEVGDFYTYLVLSDGKARLLAVLSDIATSSLFNDKLLGKKLVVWGMVKSGSKNLPYIRAMEIALD